MPRAVKTWAIAALAAVPVGAGGTDPFATLDRLLAEYVRDEGVRWAAWADHEGDRAALSDAVESLAAMRPSRMEEDARLAWWIDLYNALTLRLVLDHYPVASIREIDGPDGSPWRRKLVTVEGRELTLDEIENGIIRPEFRDPRVHFALYCAARSCPPLRPEAFVADRLDEQLEEQTDRFLRDPQRNGVDADGHLVLSRLFEWYAEDFEAAGGSVVGWVRSRLEGVPEGAEIEYREYDWALGEAAE